MSVGLHVRITIIIRPIVIVLIIPILLLLIY